MKISTYFSPKPFQQPHKMVKHAETIRRQYPTNGVWFVNHSVVLVLKRLNKLHFSRITSQGDVSTTVSAF